MSAPDRFGDVRHMTRDELLSKGCRQWDETGLMLFPADWFDDIPEGFEIVVINGERRPFSKTDSNDRRWGLLAFGIIPAQ